MTRSSPVHVCHHSLHDTVGGRAHAARGRRIDDGGDRERFPGSRSDEAQRRPRKETIRSSASRSACRHAKSARGD